MSDNGETCDCSGRLASPRREWIGAVPDLTDDGNAGILLGMLRAAAPGRIGVEWRPEGTPRIIIAQRDQRAKWGGPMSEVEGATLSEAVAGALIAVGRCA